MPRLQPLKRIKNHLPMSRLSGRHDGRRSFEFDVINFCTIVDFENVIIRYCITASVSTIDFIQSNEEEQFFNDQLYYFRF